jgi:FMN reductase
MLSAMGATGKLNILGINGSLRENSCSYLALQHAMDLVRNRGCRANIFDVRKSPLPFCNGNKTDPRPDFPAVSLLRRLVSEAHGLIIATPEYHGGMSGVMKNLLDLLDIEHLEGKVVGCISVLGGQQNSNALNDLRQVIRWCHGWVIPEQIAIAHSAKSFPDPCLRNPDLSERFDKFAGSLVRSAVRLADVDNMPLKQMSSAGLMDRGQVVAQAAVVGAKP